MSTAVIKHSECEMLDWKLQDYIDLDNLMNFILWQLQSASYGLIIAEHALSIDPSWIFWVP